jgi:uncharacterized short protein YbdD (DUF466 family)
MPVTGQDGTAVPAGPRARAATLLRCLCDGARLMVGVPSYDVYVEHMRRNHPDKPVMTYAEFFRDRQAARYGGGSGGGLRCC